MSILLVPDSWPVAPLEGVVDILDRHRVPVSAKERAKRPGTVPYYGATGQVGTIDEKLFDEPLVLLGEDGVPFLDPLASKAYLIEGPAWVNNHAHVLRVTGSLDRTFLKYWLDVVDYRGHVNGTTRLKLTQGAMRRLPVPVPPLPEQRKIIEAIGRLTSIVTNADGMLMGCRTRATAVRRSLANRLADQENFVPVSGVLAEPVRNGKSVKDGSGTPVLRLSALRDGNVDLSETKNGDWSGVDSVPFLLQEGDFLVSRGNGTLSRVGRGGLVAQQPTACAFPDTMMRLRPDPRLIDPHYLRLVWDSDFVRQQIEAAARTTAGIYKINQGILSELRIPLPDLVEQSAAVQWGERLLAHATHLEAELVKLRQRCGVLRRSILKAAFEGRLSRDVADAQSLDDLQEATA